jgi:4-amino-4-deoxy-L-arabinose transferase-like glycosyltransferase
MSSPQGFLRRWQNLLLFLLLVLAIWLPRALALGRFATPDEPNWLARSANFLYALRQGDFASTYQKEHPGVTVMWAGAAGFLWRYPEYLNGQPGQLSKDDFHSYLEKKSKEVTPLELLRAGRFFIVLFHTVVLAISFLFARRLFGVWPALLGFLLIAFDPFHLGLTRLLHTDGLLSDFVLLTVLAYCSFLQEKRLRDLLVSAVAAGLAWLTKSPGLFLAPIIGLLTLPAFWQAITQRDRESLFQRLWRPAWPVLAWFVVGVLIFVALWPAMWVHPFETLAHIFSGAQNYAEEGHDSALFFNGQVAVDGKLGLSYFYFYPLTFLWRTTPVVLLGLLPALWAFFTRRPPFDKPGARLASVALLVVVVVYLLGLTFPLKKFDRYFLPAYAPLDILAGLGWYSLALFLKERVFKGVYRYTPYLLAVAVLGIQAAGSLNTFPYYLPYYNPLLGGGRKAPAVMQIGWGEGLDQAARYLNQKKDAEKLKVIAWYPTGCFSYFFEGKARNFWQWTNITPDEWQRFFEADYAVIYVGQEQRQLTKPVLDYISKLAPEHSIWLNGIEYARIYKIRGMQ